MLTPSLDALPWKRGTASAQTGTTLHPDDPSFSEEVKALESKHRVEQRVKGFLDDASALARASRGSRHPYVSELQTGMQEGLRKADGGTPADMGTGTMQHLVKQYLDAAEAYGRTGNPGLGPPGVAPTHSEKLRELSGIGQETLALRMHVQARETLEALRDRGPVLRVTVEVVQGPASEPVSLLALESSGNELFDDFVIRNLPSAVRELGPPPAELLRGKSQLRTHWAVEGWLRPPDDTLSQASRAVGVNAFGIPVSDIVAGVAGGEPRFEFRARLLRQY